MATARRDERVYPRRASGLASRVVGRAPEIAALHDAVDRATGGQGGVAFIIGESGIGKSRLAQAVAADAAGRGLQVMVGRAVPAPTPLAYRPFAEALCGAVRSGLIPENTSELAPFRPILAWLVPAWRVDAARADDSVLALDEAVLRFLRVAGGTRGCIVVLEDLHWADPETLRIVEYLADNLASERVLCLVTVRDEGRTAGLKLARDLDARRVSRVIELSRLHSQDVAELVRSCLRADDVPADVLELAVRADGVPFLVEELLAAAVTSGALVAQGPSWVRSAIAEPGVPATFSESMRRRLTALGDHTRAVLVAAAVMGRRFDWSLLPAITALSEQQIVTAMRAAVDAHIASVDPSDGTFRFRHALSRDAVIAELLPPERTALSRRALDAVEAAHPELDDDWCQVAAELAEGAGDHSRAATLLLEMGRRSLERGALASAQAALDRAHRVLDADDPVLLDVEESLCQVLSLAGKRADALAVGGSLLARLARDPRTASRRAEVYLRLARAELAATRAEEAYALLKMARAETAAVPDDRLAARATAVSAQIAIIREPESARAIARAALDAADDLGLPEVACEALEVIGRSERRRDLGAAERAFTRALTLAEDHHLAVWRARALHELGTIEMLRGGPVARLEEARNLAVSQGALATAAVVDVQIAAALALRNDPESAAAAARRSVELARPYGLDQTLAAAFALEAHVHARAGRAAEMQRCIAEAQALCPGSPDVAAKASFAAAVLAFVEEDRARACHHLHAAVDQALMAPGGDYSALPTAGLLALVTVLDGATHARLLDEPVHFLARAFRHYADAVLAGRAGSAATSAAAVAQGDRALGDHEWFRQLGRRLLAEAALDAGWGDPVPWLREALVFFDRRGEQRIASACRSLLRKAGAPVPRRRGGDDVPPSLRSAGVTSRELEVLRLLAMGLPNKEIAARLYLSPRTVERHIANVSTKAGVAGRSQLLVFAARTLPDPTQGR